MPRRTSAGLYYAEDKDVYDLLTTSKKTLNAPALLRVARSRGILLSQSESREDVVNQLSLLEYSWPQLVDLLELTDTADRAEKISGSDIQSQASDQDLLAAAQLARDAIQEASRDDVIKIEQNPKGLRILVTYSEPNYSRTRLHQRRIRDLTVSIERSSEGFRARHEATPKAEEVVQALVRALEAGGTTDHSSIALSGIRDPHLRTKFFLNLMHWVDGFQLDNLTDFRVAALPPDNTEDDGADDEDDEDPPTSSPGTKIKPEEAAVVGHVKRAAFSGEDLLQTEEYVALVKKGYFLSRCVWRALEKAGAGRTAVFEAEFARSEYATGFKYCVRSVFERDEGGDLRRSKSSPKKHPDLWRALEEAAHKSRDQVAAEALQQPSDGKGS